MRAWRRSEGSSYAAGAGTVRVLDFRTWCRDVEPMRDASYVDRADTADAAEAIIALRRVLHPCPPSVVAETQIITPMPIAWTMSTLRPPSKNITILRVPNQSSLFPMDLLQHLPRPQYESEPRQGAKVPARPVGPEPPGTFGAQPGPRR